ncbi:serine/threonine protein kinase [Corallococcus coralloides DSM 2259]|uniref:non-specific serine/threonine protein kinase n=1 Tax=Corallococcus coralloides (strain ATCC 25202 / DSM 2259 / NBRC 100086 / M2) TaxID=1144275 RepID=H8MHT4_CORCM|nr:serine/threonine-protein kinase [Corallococcus coralloides]AFE09906.1 serine/threonine protein kinase [Corallococcus coralloides DSM 2259]
MSGCPSEETILAFVEDRLPHEQRALAEAHLSRCDSCGSLLAAVAATWHAEGRFAEAAPPPRSFAPGEQVGPYVIVDHAGSGAMGDVYRARDGRLGRDVALKVLPVRFARDPERLARFQQEARAVGALSHPHLLTLFDVGTQEDVPYLVTEWLEGVTLRARLMRGPMPPEQAVRLGIQLSQGLAAAHARGVIHRDLKPANIFLCANGSARVLDFGLARLTERIEDASLTQSGAVVGTAGYMAPEQIRGQGVDARADVFSLGAVLHEAVSGRAPFDGDSPVERMSAALRDAPPVLPGELGTVIARCLAKAPGERFQSAQDLAFALESIAARGAPLAERRRVIPRPALFAAVAVLLLFVAGGLMSFGLRQATPAVATDPSSRPTYRPVTFRRGHVLNARFSADGHTLLYGAAWEGGPAQLYSARTERPLSQPLGQHADVLAASSKGDLAVLLEPRFFDADHGSGTLGLMPLAGGAPRAVLDGVLEADWGRADGPLAVVRRVGENFRLEQPPGTVRFESQGWISHARVSPDGARIAFLFHEHPKDDRGGVWVLEKDGPPRELSSDWASIRGLAWAPDGREVWFTASRTGADSELFAVDLHGTTRPVDRIAGRMVLHDISRDGSVLVDHPVIRTGLAFGHAGAEKDLTWSDSSFMTDMSRDGRTFLFAEGAEVEGPTYGAYLRTTDGAPPIRLGDGIPMALSPDGKQVLTVRYGERMEFLLLPTGAGEPRSLSLEPVTAVLSARWFPDGKRLLLRAHEEGRPARLWVFEPGAGAPRPITAEGMGFYTVISPDGLRLATVDAEGSLRLFSQTGEALGTVPGRFTDHWVVGWDASGEALYLRSVSLPVRVSRVDVKTGASTPHLTVPAGGVMPGLISVMTMAISEDGKFYTYSYNAALSRLFLVEGLARARSSPE